MPDLTKERVMELLNGVIDMLVERNKLREVILDLMNIGFTSEELIKTFNFDANDVTFVEREREESNDE